MITIRTWTSRAALIILILAVLTACAGYPSGPREPQAGNDQYTVEEDGFLVIPAEEGILANDSPREGSEIILEKTGEIETESGGLIILAEDGGFTYQPGEDFNGVDKVEYIIKNGKGKSAASTISFKVSSLPDPPKPEDDLVDISDGRPVTIDVLANDVEPDGEAMKVTQVGRPISGTAVLNDNGLVTFTPPANHSGTIAFSYIIADSNGETANGWVFANIIADNGIDIQPDLLETAEDDPVVAPLSQLLQNDRDLTGAPLTIMALGPAQNGTSVRNADETVTYTPNPDFSGIDILTYLVQSQSGGTASTTVTVTVSAVEDAPVITPIADQTIPEDTSTEAIPFSVQDAESLPEQLTVSARSSNQNLVPKTNIVIEGRGADRSLIITPAPNQSGTARIILTAGDKQSSSSISFLLTVTPVDDLPTISAIADQTTAEDTPAGPIAFTIDDPDRTTADAQFIGTSSDQTLVPNAGISFGGSGANRTVTIQPAADQSGSTTITIAVPADQGPGVEESFLLTVTPVDDPPTIVGIAPRQTTAEDTPFTSAFTVEDVDSPVNGVRVTAASSNGRLVPAGNIRITGEPNRSITIIPAPNQSGQTTITLTTARGDSIGTFPFVLRVTQVNDPPTISAIANQQTNWNPSDPASAPDFVAINFTVGDVETPAGDLTLSAAFSPQADGQGALFGGEGANRTALIAPGRIAGNVNVSIIVTDGSGGTAAVDFIVTVNVSVTPFSYSSASDSKRMLQAAAGATLQSGVASAAGRSAHYQTAEDTLLAVAAEKGLLVGNENLKMQAVRIVSVNSLTTFYGGEARIDADGGFHYTPPANFEGEDSFSYKVVPAGSAVGRLTAKTFVTVSAINDPPLAENDLYYVDNGRTLEIASDQGVLANDRDAEDQPLQVIPQQNTRLTLNADGGFTYSPPSGFIGRETFSYAVSDGRKTSTAMLTLIAGAGPAPAARPDAYVIAGVRSLSTSAAQGLLTNDSGWNGHRPALSVTGIKDTLFGGEVNLRPNGGFDYLPPPHFDGFDSFTYTISDGKDSATGVAVISVTP